MPVGSVDIRPRPPHHRLGWPFVELFPSRLAGESAAGLAAALRETFALIAELVSDFEQDIKDYARV